MGHVVVVALRLCFFLHTGQCCEEGQRLMGWSGLRSVDRLVKPTSTGLARRECAALPYLTYLGRQAPRVQIPPAEERPGMM